MERTIVAKIGLFRLEQADFIRLRTKSSQNKAGSFAPKIEPRIGRFRPIRADSHPESTTTRICQFRWRETQAGRGRGAGGRGGGPDGEGLGRGWGDRGRGRDLVGVGQLVRSALGQPWRCHTGVRGSGDSGMTVAERRSQQQNDVGSAA